MVFNIRRRGCSDFRGRLCLFFEWNWRCLSNPNPCWILSISGRYGGRYRRMAGRRPPHDVGQLRHMCDHLCNLGRMYPPSQSARSCCGTVVSGTKRLFPPPHPDCLANRSSQYFRLFGLFDTIAPVGSAFRSRQSSAILFGAKNWIGFQHDGHAIFAPSITIFYPQAGPRQLCGCP